MKPQISDFVEGLRNLRTQKLFICLEASSSAGKVRVINPSGDILVVLEDLFDLEPVEVPVSEASDYFTPEQVKAWQAYLDDEVERRRADAERQAREAAQSAMERASQPVSRTGGTRPVQPRTSRKALSTPVKVVAGRIVAQWAGDKLVFYRHRIDPLRPSDQFRIEIHGVGSFQITKADFQRIFNNVVMSAQYRSQGIYTYDAVPDEARAFIRP